MTISAPTGILWLAAYLLGAVPFGLVIARISGAGDIRKQGSGNIGATNVLRAAGKKAGAAALLLDMIKGAAAVAAALILLPDHPYAAAGAALAAFLGHLYPVYLGFKGGKGVATGLGIFLAWTPAAGALVALGWLLAAWLSRISSVGALAAFALLPPFLFLLDAPPAALGVSLIIGPLIFWRHRENIRRLLAGTEPRIGKKGAGPPA